ncbi:DUF4268 domain-containing protein [Candidatus Mycalebacterium sp.]
MGKGKNLGKLKKVDLRQIWKKEAGDFTPWLSQEDGLSLLGETIGIELELESTEKGVGGFSADIVARDTESGSYVLIENQLERTDHTHLGQLITYAAGLNTVTIVWVSKRFAEEHRAAMDWLNEITDSKFGFFGIEVELLKIGNSPPAPKLNIVSKPNDWSKTARKKRSEGLSDGDKFKLLYWEKFREYLQDKNINLKGTKARPQNWMNFPVGKSRCKMVAVIRMNPPRIWCAFEAWYENSNPIFDFLHDQKNKIEKDFGESLYWDRAVGKKHIGISVFNESNPLDEKNREKQFKWFAEKLTKFDEVFRPRVKGFDPSDWETEEEEN